VRDTLTETSAQLRNVYITCALKPGVDAEGLGEYGDNPFTNDVHNAWHKGRTPDTRDNGIGVYGGAYLDSRTRQVVATNPLQLLFKLDGRKRHI